MRCAAHCLLFRTEAAVAAQPPAAGDGSTTGTWRWLEADQWEARHTRANHNAYCCRRAVRPHPWIASSTSARRQLLQLGQVEISAGARHCSVPFLYSVNSLCKFFFNRRENFSFVYFFYLCVRDTLYVYNITYATVILFSFFFF